MDMNTEMMKAMQELHPWLVRTTVSDENFAHILRHIDIALIREGSKNRGEFMKDLHALIEKDFKIHMGENYSMKDSLYAWAFLWIRYVCLTNKYLYKSIVASCFNKQTLVQSKEERREFIEDRLLELGIIENQIDDIYLILKGFLDSMIKVGDGVYDLYLRPILEQNISADYIKEAMKISERKIVNELNKKYKPTEDLPSHFSFNEIVEIATRDFLTGVQVHKIE